MAGHPLPGLTLAPVGEQPHDSHLPSLSLCQGHFPALGCLPGSSRPFKVLLSIKKPGPNLRLPRGWGPSSTSHDGAFRVFRGAFLCAWSRPVLFTSTATP